MFRILTYEFVYFCKFLMLYLFLILPPNLAAYCLFCLWFQLFQCMFYLCKQNVYFCRLYLIFRFPCLLFVLLIINLPFKAAGRSTAFLFSEIRKSQTKNTLYISKTSSSLEKKKDSVSRFKSKVREDWETKQTWQAKESIIIFANSYF